MVSDLIKYSMNNFIKVKDTEIERLKQEIEKLRKENEHLKSLYTDDGK